MATDTQPPPELRPPALFPLRLLSYPHSFHQYQKVKFLICGAFEGSLGPSSAAALPCPLQYVGGMGMPLVPCWRKTFYATDFSSCQYLISTVRGGAAACMAQLGGGFKCA